MSAYTDITDFIATPYDDGILLEWIAGKGAVGSTSADTCTVTIQYSYNNPPPVVPNTPPYVVRDLFGYQLTPNLIYHRNLLADVSYQYALFITYDDTDVSYGPFTLEAAVSPLSGVYNFPSGSLSYTKLGVNTRLSPYTSPKAEVIVWLFPDQAARKPIIEQSIRNISPAHTEIDILYENWYVAHTTTTQFSSQYFDSSVYEVQNGILVNKVPTIDSSYSGTPLISS